MPEVTSQPSVDTVILILLATLSRRYNRKDHDKIGFVDDTFNHSKRSQHLTDEIVSYSRANSLPEVTLLLCPETIVPDTVPSNIYVVAVAAASSVCS